jgi:hypothetical protein
MRTNTLRFKALVEYLALHVADCEQDITVWHRDRTAPAIATVYLLLDEKHNIVRVGQTCNLRRRLAQLVNNPKVQRLNWTSFAYFAPQIKHVHKRLQVETCLAAVCCPPGNTLIALRRKADTTWREVQWSINQAEKKRRAKRSTKWSERS